MKYLIDTATAFAPRSQTRCTGGGKKVTGQEC